MAYHTDDDSRLLDSYSEFCPTYIFQLATSWNCMFGSLTNFPMVQPYYKKMTKIDPVYSLSHDSSKCEVDALQAAGPLLRKSFETFRISCWLKTHTAGWETAVWAGTDTCPLDSFTIICQT